ncbi:MAG: NusA-like transcription termination signal-binding factor [Candidatus Micrarchaeota archaeon]
MRLGTQEIAYLNVFQNVSKTLAKDCIYNEQMISFVVPKGQMGLAIGKQGINIKKLRELLNKNIELFEYQKNAEGFVKNAFPNAAISEIRLMEEEGKKTVVIAADAENRRKILINGAKIKRLKELAKRNYGVDDIQIGK